MIDVYLPYALGDPTGATITDADDIWDFVDSNCRIGTSTNWCNLILKPQSLTAATYWLEKSLTFTNIRYLKVSAAGVTIRRETIGPPPGPGNGMRALVRLDAVKDFWWHHGRLLGPPNPVLIQGSHEEAGFLLRNSKDVQISQVTTRDNTGQNRGLCGDNVWLFTGGSSVPDPWPGLAGTNERIWVHHCAFGKTTRMGVGIERIDHFVLEHCSFVDGYRSTFDIEPTGNWLCRNLWFLDGTVGPGPGIGFGFISNAYGQGTKHNICARRWTLTGKALAIYNGTNHNIERRTNFIFEDIHSNTTAGRSNLPISLYNIDNLIIRRCSAPKNYSGSATPAHPEFANIQGCTNVFAPSLDEDPIDGNDFGPALIANQIMQFPGGTPHPSGYAAHIAADQGAFGPFTPFDMPRPDIEGGEGGSWGQPPSIVTTPPAAPTGLTATPTATQIALNWNDAADTNQWQVFRRNTDTTWPTVPTAVPVTSDWTDVGIPDATLRFYRVYAYNTTTGLVSTTYAETSATTPSVAPGAPTDVATGSDTTSITISWDPRPLSEDVVNYRVYRSLNGTTGWTEIAEVDEFTLSHHDTPLAVGSLRYYYVTAVDGDDDESVASAVVNDTVQAPTLSYYVPLAEVGTARVGGPDRIGGLGRDREFVAADTLTYGITDAKTGLVSTSARTDTLTVGITETKATLVLLSRTDTLTVGVTDVKTGLVSTSTRTDTLTAGITDATSTLVSSSSRSDTLTAGITDAATIASTSALTDTLTVGISDQSSVAFDVELLVASDTLTVGITDAATDVIVGLDATDTPTVGITDAFSTLASSSDVVDELTVGADEATVHVDGTMATSDELTVGIDDQTVAGDAIMLDVTDTLSVAIDESSILETQGGPNDDLILEIVEAASIIATVVTGDTFAMSAGDMVLARSLVSEPLPDETVDLILA